jgi:long-chain acyl-CoA synthetase
VSDAPLDGLLRRAAQRWPDRTAIHDGSGPRTFAELDAEVDARAGALAGLLAANGLDRARIAVASTLSVSFAVSFTAIPRGGNVIVLVNPMLRGAGLAHVVRAGRAGIAIVPADQAAQLIAVRDSLPDLRAIVVDGGEAPAGSTALAGLAPGRYAPAGPPDPGDVVCVQFTSGTTGAPKGVRLSHRNLVTNAAQIATAHQLDAGSVTVNHLPLFHLMHLNSGLYAGAEQVLCPLPDPLTALDLAIRCDATHLYSLPARLARLAAVPERIPALDGTRLRGLFSGGSALAPADAQVIARRTGVPVVQGYGLAELSPLTHCDTPSDPVPGSVGRPVDGTECRIVDLNTREPLSPGQRGEVLLRGPQLMLGYLDSTVGHGAWFATGDLGYTDPDGRLYLVDRIKDTFKCDNELASPTEMERLLAADPAVTDCVVTDRPDRFSGAVPIAGVVLRAGRGENELPRLRDAANEHLPHVLRIRTIWAIDEVVRSPNGKVDRRAMRRLLRDLAERQASPTP